MCLCEFVLLPCLSSGSLCLNSGNLHKESDGHYLFIYLDVVEANSEIFE